MQNKEGTIFTHKSDDGAWRFVGSQGYRKFLASYLTEDIEQVILHTRAATTGNPRFPKNNHPIEDGKGSIVHNGSLHNDVELFKDLNLERRADTDSDIIRAIVDEHGLTKKAVEKLNRLRGSAAIACLHPEYPGRMLLGRSGSPLWIATTEHTPDMKDYRFLFFASTKNAIHRCARPYTKRFGIDACFLALDIAFAPMADDTAWILGPEGKEWHQEFRTLVGRYIPPDYGHLKSNFTGRQGRWTRESKWGPDSCMQKEPKKDLVQSSGVFVNCGNCGLLLELSPEQQCKDRSELFCPKESGCGSPLSYKKPKLLTH